MPLVQLVVDGASVAVEWAQGGDLDAHRCPEAGAGALGHAGAPTSNGQVLTRRPAGQGQPAVTGTQLPYAQTRLTHRPLPRGGTACPPKRL